MHLPQVWGIRTIFQNVIPMLHLFAQMCIPFNAKVGNKANRQYIELAESVVLAAAHCGDDGGHTVSSRLSESLGLDAGELDHLAPLLGIVLNEFSKFGRRSGKDSAPKVGETHSHGGIGKTRVDFLVKLLDDI